MSEELIEDMAAAENLQNITRILAEIREAEALAATKKNELLAMGYRAARVEAATTSSECTNECNARYIIDGFGCSCPMEPEAAFTPEGIV